MVVVSAATRATLATGNVPMLHDIAIASIALLVIFVPQVLALRLGGRDEVAAEG